MRYVREAREKDVPKLLELARTVNFINLPPFEDVIGQMVARSTRSFAASLGGDGPGDDDDRSDRQYIFVLADSSDDECIGTSSLRAGMGGVEHPNLSFQLVKVVRRSADLLPILHAADDERLSALVTGRVEHVLARLYRDTSSPTELGGLLLPPERRGGGLGKLLSWVRFHYVARKPGWFSDRLLAEMMPPIDPYNDGNVFWRCLTKKFINLSYDDADRLSTVRREFMYSLLPQTVNLSLLPDAVLDQLGRVNRITEPAKRLLEELGFRYVHRVDPFDAGPHLEADRDSVSVVKQTAEYEFGGVLQATDFTQEFDPTQPAGDFTPEEQAGHRGLVSTYREGEGFRAVNARYLVGSGGAILLSPDAAATLGLEQGERFYLTPYEIPTEVHGDEPIPTVMLGAHGAATPARLEGMLTAFDGRGPGIGSDGAAAGGDAPAMEATA